MAWPHPVQINFSSPCRISTRGTDYAPGSSDLPTALYICMETRSGRFYATYFSSTKVTTIQIPYFLNNILPWLRIYEWFPSIWMLLFTVHSTLERKKIFTSHAIAFFFENRLLKEGINHRQMKKYWKFLQKNRGIPPCFFWGWERVTTVFCYQNCSDLLWEKIVPVIEKN